MTERVVITGIGVVTSLGDRSEQLFERCLGRESVSAPLPEGWNRFGTLNADTWAPLPEPTYNPEELSRIECKQLDPVSRNAIHAAFRAVEEAGLDARIVDEKRRTYAVRGLVPAETGVYMGTGVGGVHTIGETYAHQILAPLVDDMTKPLSDAPFPKRFNPFTVPMLMPNAAAANIAIKLGITGPNLTIALACASGTAAVGHCYRAVRQGEIAVGLAGGSEYLFDPYGTIFRGFDAVKTLAHGFTPSAAANRPFDADRSGFLFSQGGAAVLLIEAESHAAKRGVVPIAEIAGYAETADAYNIMMMEKSGAPIEQMLKKLFAVSNTPPHAVDYINGHGTGTTLNDAVESEVIARTYRKDVFVNSTKALIGHAIGASGAIEAAVTALSLSKGAIHGMPHLDTPIADLNFTTKSLYAEISAAVSHSFAFGGHNTGLLLKRYTP